MAAEARPKRVTLTPKQAAVRKEAHRLLRAHGLAGWRFAFDNAKTRLGLCDYGSRTISLSKHWVEVRPIEDSQATIIHEVAHALAGPRTKHGPVWKAHARALGLANPKPCTDTGDLSIGAPWVGTCPNGHKQEMHRSPKRVSACGRCSKRFDFRYLLTWRKHGKEVAMSPAYVAELEKLRKKYGKA